jgi:hypothetical protein
MAFSITTLSMTIKTHSYLNITQHKALGTVMLSVANKPIILSKTMLIVIMLNAVMMSVVVPMLTSFFIS